VFEVVDPVPLRTDGRDGRGKVVNLDREVRGVHRRVGRLEEVDLAVLKLKPRAGIVGTLGAIDDRQTEHISIERQSGIGVVHDERNVVDASTTGFCHDGIMPAADVIDTRPIGSDLCAPLGAADAVELPGSGHAFEFVLAMWLSPDDSSDATIREPRRDRLPRSEAHVHDPANAGDRSPGPGLLDRPDPCCTAAAGPGRAGSARTYQSEVERQAALIVLAENVLRVEPDYTSGLVT
jgi:hypothetical protein